ncbi:MAG: helix-turn-helix domain-containing protein [Chloroflexota bacterium]|nr:helix-turn-helix domain-containing protein [Chloroflexota bacterium]
MTENNRINDSSTLDESTEHEGGSKPFMGASKSNFWWPWDSGEDRRKRLIARDHFLTLAQETAVALKAARLQSKMTISDIESLTFVNAQILESIEQGQWDRLPARVYSRGAAFNYATAVGLTNPNTHADNISNVLNKPSHLNPSIGLMKKRSRNVQELRIEIISLAALIILVVGSIVWFQNNYSITELLNLDNTSDETTNIVDLTFPIVLSVMHPRALRSKHMYTQGYEHKRRRIS